jgi:uncharacterized protein YjiS (DUF1127 family)
LQHRGRGTNGKDIPMSAVYDERKSPLFIAPAARASGLTGLLQLFGARLLAWRRYQVTYRQLAALDDRQLADIGLGRGEIERAAHGYRPAEVA